jgi:hypothetical protein
MDRPGAPVSTASARSTKRFVPPSGTKPSRLPDPPGGWKVANLRLRAFAALCAPWQLDDRRAPVGAVSREGAPQRPALSSAMGRDDRTRARAPAADLVASADVVRWVATAGRWGTPPHARSGRHSADGTATRNPRPDKTAAREPRTANRKPEPTNRNRDLKRVRSAPSHWPTLPRSELAGTVDRSMRFTGALPGCRAPLKGAYETALRTLAGNRLRCRP